MTGSPRRRALAKSVLHRVLLTGQRLGVDVLPRHFYSGVPDLRSLSASTHWRVPYSLVGLEGFDLDRQLDTLRSWFSPAVRALVADRDLQAEASAANGALGYGRSEASVLYAFTATVRPRRVLQIGAGVSTEVLLRAASEADHDVAVTCIDPFPTDHLVRLAETGRIHLDRRPAQEVPVEELVDLDDGDLVFVDSTHTVKPGSEVSRIVLEVLPRLRPGVWAHFHDIWIPHDYPPDLLTDALFFWNESVLLHAYLADNARISTAVSCSWLHHVARHELGAVVPGHVPADTPDGLHADRARRGQFPSSTYLRVRDTAPDP